MLGLRTITAGRRLAGSPHPSARVGPSMPVSAPQHRHAFKMALLTNLTNPKVMLFFGAILLQFVDQSATLPPALQLGVLGIVDVLAGIALLPIVVTFGARFFGQLSFHSSPVDSRMKAFAISGAASELLISWAEGLLDITPAQLGDFLVGLYWRINLP